MSRRAVADQCSSPDMTHIKGSYVLNGFAALVLFCTMSLFAYEVSKPPIRSTRTKQEFAKPSAFAAADTVPQRLVRLPELSERFKRKLISLGVHRATGKKYAPAPTAGKHYIAMNRASAAGLE
jgi:hypothetical protein